MQQSNMPYKASLKDLYIDPYNPHISPYGTQVGPFSPCNTNGGLFNPCASTNGESFNLLVSNGGPLKPSISNGDHFHPCDMNGGPFTNCGIQAGTFSQGPLSNGKFSPGQNISPHSTITDTRKLNGTNMNPDFLKTKVTSLNSDTEKSKLTDLNSNSVKSKVHSKNSDSAKTKTPSINSESAKSKVASSGRDKNKMALWESDKAGNIRHETNGFKNGAKCLRCGDACPGLDLHYFRKICRNCRCPAEDHDLPSCQQRDCRPISLLFTPEVSPPPSPTHSPELPSPELPSPRLPSPRLPSPEPEPEPDLKNLTIDDPVGLTQLRKGPNDHVVNQLISENVKSQKLISELPEDKQEFVTQLRRKQLQRQLPLHDLDPRFCTSLAESEQGKFEKFSERRKKKAAGIGQIGQVIATTDQSCHFCQQTMEQGSPAIVATKVAGHVWHPGCFVCHSCQQVLVDMIYFCRKGEVYCERHYADLLYPRCTACDEMIFSREYTQAEGGAWHVHHFCCFSCDTKLAGQRYIAQEGNPYCVTCYDKLFSKMCQTCQKPITGDEPGVTHGDNNWHACPHCFSCSSCGRYLLDHLFKLRSSRLYCGKECRQNLTASLTRQI